MTKNITFGSFLGGIALGGAVFANPKDFPIRIVFLASAMYFFASVSILMVDYAIAKLKEKK